MDKICLNCAGSGQEVIGENRVSMDMAIDAGDASLAGQFHSYEYQECYVCQGVGIIDDTQVENVAPIEGVEKFLEIASKIK